MSEITKPIMLDETGEEIRDAIKELSANITKLTGPAGKDGRDGVDGSPGKDGVSATHSWDGTVLTITSASGTSSADLKGDPGEAGIPSASSSDNGKFLRVVDGNPAWTTVQNIEEVEF